MIGLVGTAPDADETSFPLNTPVLIAGSRLEAAKLGSTGTLPMAIDGIFDQAHIGGDEPGIHAPFAQGDRCSFAFGHATARDDQPRAARIDQPSGYGKAQTLRTTRDHGDRLARVKHRRQPRPSHQ